MLKFFCFAYGLGALLLCGTEAYASNFSVALNKKQRLILLLGLDRITFFKKNNKADKCYCLLLVLWQWFWIAFLLMTPVVLKFLRICSGHPAIEQICILYIRCVANKLSDIFMLECCMLALDFLICALRRAWQKHKTVSAFKKSRQEVENLAYKIQSAFSDDLYIGKDTPVTASAEAVFEEAKAFLQDRGYAYIKKIGTGVFFCKRENKGLSYCVAYMPYVSAKTEIDGLTKQIEKNFPEDICIEKDSPVPKDMNEEQQEVFACVKTFMEKYGFNHMKKYADKVVFESKNAKEAEEEASKIITVKEIDAGWIYCEII